MSESRSDGAALPLGSTIGILGGGQLGLMITEAAHALGLRTCVWTGDAADPAVRAADDHRIGPFDDPDLAAAMVRRADVVTVETEHIPAPLLARLAESRPVRPAPGVVATAQDRLGEKRWLAAHGFPLPRWAEARSAAELSEVVRRVGGDAIAKATRFGYDGKGQVVVTTGRTGEDGAGDPAAAWRALGVDTAVVEEKLALEMEFSVVCARTPAGEMACFPPIENRHVRGILDTSALPASVPARLAEEGAQLARAISEQLGVVGLLTVEFFVAAGGRLLVNELAPRPHNSGHATIEAGETSQFAQHVRAIAAWPLGPTDCRPAAMANLLGDLWADGEPGWEALGRFPDVRLHLYGKKSARLGRKMGHLTALGPSPDAARERVIAARAAL